MEQRRDLRDKRGLVPKAGPTEGSYAEQRMEQLAKERKMYNVNHLGYYNGGVPQKGRGAKRGKAVGNIGRFHHPDTHNFLEYNHQDTN